MHLDGDRVPFDLRVFESGLGLYEIQVCVGVCVGVRACVRARARACDNALV